MMMMMMTILGFPSIFLHVEFFRPFQQIEYLEEHHKFQDLMVSSSWWRRYRDDKVVYFTGIS